MLPCFLNLGTGELIIIFVVIILLFGAKRIPELARSMGKGISMFKQGMNETVSQINEPSVQNKESSASTKTNVGSASNSSTSESGKQ